MSAHANARYFDTQMHEPNLTHKAVTWAIFTDLTHHGPRRPNEGWIDETPMTQRRTMDHRNNDGRPKDTPRRTNSTPWNTETPMTNRRMDQRSSDDQSKDHGPRRTNSTWNIDTRMTNRRNDHHDTDNQTRDGSPRPR